MNDILPKIYKSRQSIIDIYKQYEWNTDEIPRLSITELDAIFNGYKSSDSFIQSFGEGMALNLKIPHQYIENHNLYVLYYNMYNNSKSSKVSKSLVDKIVELYKTDLVNHDDSLLILVNETDTNSIEKINHTINYEINKNYQVSESIEPYVYSPEKPVNTTNKHFHKYNRNYFRHCIIMNIDMFQVNLLQHYLVPRHEVIYNQTEIESLCKKLNITPSQMPIISVKDAIAKIIRLNKGNVCKITRKTMNSGDTIYYRLCR